MPQQSRMEEFRSFINNYPKLRDEVRTGNRTWQKVYEDWVILGESDSSWKDYKKEESKEKKENSNSLPINMDGIKGIVNYIKKINPDNLNKTLNTAQKVIQIAQTIGGGKGAAVAPIVSSAYSDWWD